MDVYYIEYKNSIKFFKEGGSLEIPKNQKTYYFIKRLQKSKKYNLINLL